MDNGENKMTKQDTKKINDALEMLNQAAQGKKEDFSKLLTDKFGDLKKAFHDMESDVSDEASEGLEKLKSLRDSAVGHTKDTAASVDKKVHDAPWISLGLTLVTAVALGVLLGKKN